MTKKLCMIDCFSTSNLQLNSEFLQDNIYDKAVYLKCIEEEKRRKRREPFVLIFFIIICFVFAKAPIIISFAAGMLLAAKISRLW